MITDVNQAKKGIVLTKKDFEDGMIIIKVKEEDFENGTVTINIDTTKSFKMRKAAEEAKKKEVKEEAKKEEVKDTRPRVKDHPNCRMGECDDCHVVWCPIYQGLEYAVPENIGKNVT